MIYMIKLRVPIKCYSIKQQSVSQGHPEEEDLQMELYSIIVKEKKSEESDEQKICFPTKSFSMQWSQC